MEVNLINDKLHWIILDYSGFHRSDYFTYCRKGHCNVTARDMGDNFWFLLFSIMIGVSLIH